MTGAPRVLTSAIVGGLMVMSATSLARAQTLSRLSPLDTRQASFSAGSLVGTVSDDAGAPIEGAVVSALGASTTVAVTDGKGHFEFDRLSPGPYLVRAYFTGHAASRPQIIQVRSSVRTVSGIALHRANETVPLLAAGIGPSDPLVPPPAQAAPAPQDRSGAPAPGNPAGNGEETTWRIRHARRSVLKDVTIPDELLGAAASSPGRNGFSPVDVLGQVAGSSARLATSLFSTTPLSGQVNLLTTGSFDTPLQLFSQDALSRNVADLRVSAPVGDVADWTVRGALTRADLTSWIVAGSYTTRMPARHRYDLGMSYSTQRYDGNPLALRDVTDGSRNAATMYGYDTIALGTAATLTYGGAYARYDYLDQRSLISPRAELTLTPADRWRVTAVLARQALAPGAEEFLPPGESGLWLPPQRTFSAIDPDQRFVSERGVQAAVAVEHDLGATTVIVRTFRQRVADQLVAVFGADLPFQQSARLGHYFVGNVAQAQADGFGAGVRTVIGNRVHASIGYTAAYADLSSADDLRYLLVLPSAGSARAVTLIHDVTTSIETEVPETATRVLVFYRVSNGFARAATAYDNGIRPAFDGRFDVQLRQSLPFMNFSNAKWEMLFAVRNFFRDSSSDQFLYDELLVARPPKRLVGGVTLHF